MSFQQVSTTLRSYLSNFMVRKIDFSMMSHFLKQTLSLPSGFFVAAQDGGHHGPLPGERHDPAVHDRRPPVTTVLNLLMASIDFGVMLAYNVKLTLLLMAFVPLMFLISTAALARRSIKDYARGSSTPPPTSSRSW